MKGRRSVKMVLLIFLAALGVLLYADLRSVHQIFRVTQTMVDTAPDARSRERLIADKERRDGEERRHRELIGVALALDACLFIWAAISLLRQPHI